MARKVKNSIIIAIFILLAHICGGGALVAKTLPNIQNFKQPYLHLVSSVSQVGAIVRFPVLLVEFEDEKFSLEDPVMSFSKMLNSKGYSVDGAAGSVADYLNENFRGKLTFSFDVSNIITLEKPISAYGASGSLYNDVDVLQLVKDACSAALVQGVDFTRYDNDKDGAVDNLCIVFAGYSQAEGGDPDSIWPHQRDIVDEKVLDADIKIASYTCTSELRGSQGNKSSSVGAFCHEFSHFLGLPDLYDANGAEEGDAAALYGSLSVMEKGNFLDNGNTPPYYNAVEREILGMARIEDIASDAFYSLSPINKSDVIYRIPTSNEGEYFLLECRGGEGWDAHIGGKGLIVYHVDKSKAEYGGVSSESRWKLNIINCYAPHECVKVISAAGLVENVGEIFFPGLSGKDKLLPNEGKMPLRDWAGHPVGVGLVDIVQNGENVEFRTIKEQAFDASLPDVNGGKVIPYQNEIRVQWLGDTGDDISAKWRVEWKLDGYDNFTSAFSDKNVYYIRNVVPGGNYEIRVSAVSGNLYGTPYLAQTQSIPISSIFPFVFTDSNGYSVGDIIDLRVFNLFDTHISVEWYANGVRLDKDYLIADKREEIELVAVIKYYDGSEEKIYKKIRVR